MFLQTTRPGAAVLPSAGTGKADLYHGVPPTPSAGVEKAELCTHQVSSTPAPARTVLGLQQGTWSTQPRGPMSAQPLPQTPLTPMHAEVTAVLVQGFQRGDIRSSRSNLIDPLDGLHHFVPLLLRKDGGALVLGNLLWGRNKIPVRSTSCSCSDSQSQLPHSFHGQVNFTAGLSSARDHSEVANEAPDRSENIFIHLHFLSV